MKRLVSLMLFLFTALLPCFAASWVTIQDKIYIDKSSITYNNNSQTVRVWVKYLNNKKVPTEAIIGKKMSYMIVYTEFDCQNKRSRTIKAAFYGLKGNILGTFDDIDDWGYLVPDTVNYGIGRDLCHAAFGKEWL